MPLPSLLGHLGPPVPAIDLKGLGVTKLRSYANAWKLTDKTKPSLNELLKLVQRTWADDRANAAAVAALGANDREILSVYRRYGGVVDGALIRVELLTRGLIRIKESGQSYYRYRHWERDPLQSLVAKGFLVASRDRHRYSYRHGVDAPLTDCGLNPVLENVVSPAGPTPWRPTLAEGEVQSLGWRATAEVALGLNRLFTFVATHTLKTTKSGDLAQPALRALVKGVPLPEDADFPLPEWHAFLVAILRHARVLEVERGGAGKADSSAAAELSGRPAAEQAHLWARAWLDCLSWRDGAGLRSREGYGGDDVQTEKRRTLAWALGTAAHLGDAWIDLEAMLTAFHRDDIDRYSTYSLHGAAWDPGFATARGRERFDDPDRERASWMAEVGRFYANAVMVTLPALGLVERGRTKSGAKPKWCFRLTAMGRAVFGAPEIDVPAEPAAQPFLVVQPNFDVVAYLDRADAASAGTLGLIAEPAGGGASSGPVQTFRLTAASVYTALESGMEREALVGFLRNHNAGALPPNVLQTLAEWSARREALVVRSGLRLTAFPSREARDAYLADERQATACGERFVLEPEGQGHPPAQTVLTSDHLGRLRQMLEVTEEGKVVTHRPLDVVQTARLLRIAERDADGWRLTPASVGKARKDGLKPATVRRWLTEHLARPMPPLVERALSAWLGESSLLHLADAVLLRVADEKLFAALIDSQRVRGWLTGSPGPGWLMVRKDAVKEFKRLLSGLGFTVNDQLPSGEWFGLRENA